MYYGGIKNCDIANGYGVRVSLFVSGCRNRCKGCFQPETWDFHYGEPFDHGTEQRIYDMLRPDYINGLSILGGDPFEPENQKALLPFVRYIKLCMPSKTVWIYTGYIYEQIARNGSKTHCEATDELLRMTDVLVDGPFVEDLKDISLRFRGSSNQRIIDMERTRKEGRVAIWYG